MHANGEQWTQSEVRNREKTDNESQANYTGPQSFTQMLTIISTVSQWEAQPSLCAVKWNTPIYMHTQDVLL